MFRDFFGILPPVVKNLLILNIILHIATIMSGEIIQGSGFYKFHEHLSMYYLGNPGFKPYQAVTHLFMHGSFTHLFFNMFSLAMFGPLLERVWGPKRFLLFYFVCGLGAGLIQQVSLMYDVYHHVGTIFPQDVLQQNMAGQSYFTLSMGASGAIYGILAAFAMLFPNMEMLLFFAIPTKAKYIIPAFIFIELFLATSQFRDDNIAHYAHLGGALFGVILVLIWRRSRNNFY